MLKIESDAVGATRNDAGHACDACRASASAVYCRADLAFLCTSCDSRIHTAAATANNCRHERVWVCESCRRAPAALLCKADSAFLCPACDSDIHAANPLARRHMRVPIQPIYGPVDVNSIHLPPGTVDGDDEDEAASWLLMNPLKNGTNGEDAALFDDYLDLNGGYNSCHNFDQSNDQQSQHKQQHSEQDYSVPIGHYENVEDPEKNHCFQLGSQYQQEQQAYSSSLPHSISFSSMDVGIVPESTSEVSNSHSISVSPKGGINDLLSSASVLSPSDREARVLRYREKKKNRKFEKTIRYASRKAYAETRPRVKGRFAKRAEMDGEEDQMLCSPSSIVGPDGGYGVVPLI